MSAIYGLLNLDGEPVAPGLLERMDAALSAHGADGGGRWRRGAIGLGQRLMRFTPQDAAERQPLVSADEHVVLVSDGRLDNRPELLEALQARSQDHSSLVSATPVPDSALILQAYETWGQDCVHHLCGVFAFVLWDERIQTLLAARSPIAAPNLVYCATSRRFAFATMPSGLHALPDVPRALDEESLAGLLVDLDDRPQATLYRNIACLPTGHWLRAGPEGVATGCFWRPDLGRELRLAGDGDYLEAFGALFERVIADYLCRTSSVALQMSGGLDSTAVAAVAAGQLAACGERIIAYTEVPREGFAGAQPPGWYADETPFVQAMAAMYPNLELNLLQTNGRSYLDGLDAWFAHLEMPFRNASNLTWIDQIYRASHERGARVVLDGMQGNLTLSWDGQGLIPMLFRAGHWRQALHEARTRAKAGSGKSPARILIGQGLLPWLPDPLWLAVERSLNPEARRAQPWLAASLIHAQFAADQRVTERAHASRYAVRWRTRGDTRFTRYEGLASQDPGVYLSAQRAMFGVDSRSPTADVRLAEFCLALPESQYRREGQTRCLVRRALAQRLPAAVLENRQRGMQAADWFERLTGARGQIAADLIRLEHSELARRVLDLGRLRRMADQMPSAEADGVETLFQEYRLVFERGLTLARFLLWFEAGA
jgi:asparagine synthase (glutamine-hydrolysing)